MMKLDIVIIIMCVMSAIVCAVNGFLIGFVMNLANIAICIYDIVETRGDKH